MKKLLLIPVCIFLFSGCSNTKELEERITKLESELDDCKNGADKLYGKLQNAFENEKHSEVVAIYANLLKKHPGSNESSTAEAIANQSKVIVDRLKAEEGEKKERLKAEEKAKIEKAEKDKLASLNKLKKNFDDVSGVTWYKQPYFTHYTNTNKVSIYVGDNGSSRWMNLMMTYTGEDWIFFKRAFLSYDGITEEIFFDEYKDKKSDNGGGIWEWIEISGIDNSLINFLEKFANSPNAKVRYSGKYTKTRTLTANERKGIIDVINGYKVLNTN